MRLISAVLGFALRKLGLVAAVVLSLFLGLLLVSALVPALREAEAERERLAEVAQRRADLQADVDELSSAYEAAQARATDTLTIEVAAEVKAGTGRVSDQESEVDDRRGDLCGRIESLAEDVLPGPNPCQEAQEALDAAEEALATFEDNLADARADAAVLADPSLSNEEKLERLGEDGGLAADAREIDNAESELAQAEADEDSLRASQGSWAGRVVDLWARSWRWLLWTAILLVLAPGLLRVVSYFVLMPLVKRAHRPIHLAEDAPFISFAAGLYGLSRVTGDGIATSATLATPDDPDSYLMRIDFRDHPGVVMRPRHVVGVVGTPDLQTRWRWGVQSLATWQVRYILFSGTGSLIVQGSGDVVATDPGGRSTRMEQHLVMGFDSRLVVGVNRTEVFWPYLWGRTPLVDDEFTGSHPLLWQKASGDGPSSPIAKVFDAFWSAFGKVLGF